MTDHHIDSVKKRYFYKLLGNLSSLFFGFATIVFVPRILGPKDLGQFEFISANFQLVLNTFSLGMPLAYFNWVSKKSETENVDEITGYNFIFIFLLSIGFAFFIYISDILSFHQIFWPEIPVWVLWSGFFLAFFLFVYQFLSYLTDGKALTAGFEKFRMGQNVLRAIAIMLLVIIGGLNLFSYFWLQTGILVFILILVFFWLGKEKAITGKIFQVNLYSKAKFLEHKKFVLEYTQPLILYSFVGFLVAFLDRWLLQFIGGSVEQGFYGISLKLGTLAYLFTNAMTPVLTREFAFAHEKNDFERLRNLFKKIQFFLFLASITGIFISIQSYNIIEVIGGEKYKDAILPIAIMAFSPIHQTFGQLSSSLYLASGNTRLYSKIGIYLMLMGMPVTYICLAPKNFFIPGLELQATGLAIKMVLVQFLATNIMLYFNCKFLKISFLQWIWIQLRVILSVLVIALLAKVAVDLFLVKNQFLENFLKIFFEENTKIFHYAINIRIFSALAQIMAGGMFFMALIILLLKAYPRISGLSKDELREYLLLFRNKLSLKRSV